jgi:protein-S-isoprenylcysteine O-methyltransferase Ste14
MPGGAFGEQTVEASNSAASRSTYDRPAYTGLFGGELVREDGRPDRHTVIGTWTLAGVLLSLLVTRDTAVANAAARLGEVMPAASEGDSRATLDQALPQDMPLRWSGAYAGKPSRAAKRRGPSLHLTQDAGGQRLGAMTPSQPRVVPPVYFLSCIVAMVLLDRSIPSLRFVEGTIRWVGVLPLALGLALNGMSAALFPSKGTPLVPGSEATVMVRSDAFRYTRNPMYLGFSLMLLGIALLIDSLSLLLVLPLFVWTMQTLFIQKEKRWIEDRFGEEYLSYKRQTRRWL